MRYLTGQTLRARITLLTALGLIIGAVVFSLLALRAVNQATEVMLQDRLTTAHLVADYLDDALERSLDELIITASKLETDSADGKLESHIEALTDTYSRLSIFTDSIYLLNSHGEIVWSKPQAPIFSGYDLSLYPSIKETKEIGKPVISGLVIAPITNTPVIFLSTFTKESTQGKKHLLVVAIDPAKSSIGGFIRPIKLGTTGYVEVVDLKGVVITRTEPGPTIAPFERSDHSGRFAELIEAGKETRGLCHTCHDPVYRVERRDMLAFVPLSQARWGVIIRQSEVESLAPANELRWSLSIFGLVFVAGILVFVLVTTQNLVKRIKILITASQKIALGDLVSPIDDSQKDEVGVLARTFEDMRIKLKASYAEVEQRTEEFSSLLSVSEVLSRLPDLSNLSTALGSALDKTLDIMKESRGSILLLDGNGKKLSCIVNRSLYEEPFSRIRFNLEEHIEGITTQTGEAVIITDISNYPDTGYKHMVCTGDIRGFASIPLNSKDRILGVMNIASNEGHRFSPEDIRLLKSIAVQMATAIENASLHQEVQKKEGIRGELLQDILLIQEEERKRIARELHDETSQVLASLNASLEVAASMLPTGVLKAKNMLRKAQALSVSILDGIHKLIYELRPSLLDDWGLEAAIQWLIDNNLKEAEVETSLKTKGKTIRLDPKLETIMFRVIQEAVRNIVRHADAKSARIILNFDGTSIKAQIYDDGRGFDVEEALTSKDRPRGLGLLGMKERVELVNGILNIQSNPDGRGTKIDIEIPLN